MLAKRLGSCRQEPRAICLFGSNHAQAGSNPKVRVADPSANEDRNPDYLLKLAAKLSRDMGLP